MAGYFNLYKTPTIIRRIGRRMNENGFKKLDDYVRFLEDNEKEVKILGQDFLIGVTKFFRDKESFELLSDSIIPGILETKADRDVIKVWVCACSTGQEAYSIAILINECLLKVKKNIEVKIFATDIDEKSIEIAARNQYPLSIKNEVSPAYLKKYFVQEGKFYSVIPEIRKQVVFAKHDVIKSPPFIKNDLVSCRNMLIYMNSILQEKVLSTFHFSLNKGGYLFLGSSETANALKEGVSEISGKSKIYQKSAPINYASYNTYNTSGRLLARQEKSTRTSTDLPMTPVEKRFNKFITSDLGFVGVFIDKSYVIREAVGNYRQFLTLPDQKIELNILKMVPKEISIVLNTALRSVWKEQKNVNLNKMRFHRQDEDVYLNISIQTPEDEGGYTMIVFSESIIDIIPDKEELNLLSLTGEQHNEYIYELEAELNETRNNLQLSVEEMETTNEELQSTNEELLSANEELQSSNEELQSLNEELHTLNTEHQLKIKELVELNDDLDNYFRSTDIGQVFVDPSLHIRKFNPAAIHMVNMIDADVGRSIEHISNNIQADNLSEDIRAVLLNGRIVEKEVVLKNGSRSLMRIMPYLRKDKKKDGVVITFVDISHITELNNMITGVFNASLSGILAFSAVRNQDHFIVDFKCISFNNASLDLLHVSKEDLTNAMLVKQIPQLSNGNLFQKYINLVEKGTSIEAEFMGADEQWYHLVAVKMADGFAATLTDITSQKLAEQKLKRNYNELVNTREILKKLNTDLELKVQERTKELSESEERFNQVSRATNDTIWDWNLANNTMWRSDNFRSMFGYVQDKESNSIGFWFEKIHPEDRQRVRDSVFEAINRHDKQWSAEYRLKKQDEEYAIILDRGSIMQDDFGTPYRMVGSMVDITRLVDAETKLNSSEKRFRKVFDSNVIGMLFSNLDTFIIEDANDAFLNMVRYSREDLEQSLSWKDITPPEYLEISSYHVEQVRNHGVCPPFEKQYICKNGEVISVMIGSALLDESNSSEVVTYVINITEQKRIEERQNELQQMISKQQDEFYSIFKNAPAMITIRRGPELIYEFINNAFIEFYGNRNYIGRSSADMHPNNQVEKIREMEEHVLQTGETVVAKTFFVQRENENGEKSDFWFDLIFTPVFTADGDIDGIAFFGFDVTDLLKAQQATKDLMQRKDEFMSIASHELKTPITSIQGFLQLALKLAKKSQSGDQMLNFIEKANRQLVNLTSLVNDLLDVTKIQAGKMQFNYGYFNVKEMLEECIGDIQNTGKHQVVIEHANDIQVFADQHRIEQVVNNFLSNAIKYSPDHTKVIVFTTVIGEELRLTVKDFGLGIPADKTEQVFDRFFRVNDTSSMISGLGLGLYISSEIIHRHGGTIGVDSVINEGSEFWFQIPLKVG
jgi:two-component system CheB/CheR fusion protein